MITATRQHASRPGFREELKRRFSIWLLQHLQAFIFSLGQYIRYPIGNILTTAVIGISLALPSSFFLLLENAKQVTSGWDGTVQFSVFLKPEIELDAAKALVSILTADNAIEKVILIDKQQALDEYKRLSGFAEILDQLDENPLPHLLLIKPATSLQADPNQLEPLFRQLSQLDAVDLVQYDRQWIKRLLVLLDIIKRVILILSTLLAMAVLLIVGNTIRLSIYNRKQEIEITKLFGASNAFIQRPFLYSGLWYGLFGSIIAWLLISASLLILKEPIHKLAALYNSPFSMVTPSFSHFMILLLIGIILGLGGSWISVHRHIDAIEPA